MHNLIYDPRSTTEPSLCGHAYFAVVFKNFPWHWHISTEVVPFHRKNLWNAHCINRHKKRLLDLSFIITESRIRLITLSTEKKTFSYGISSITLLEYAIVFRYLLILLTCDIRTRIDTSLRNRHISRHIICMYARVC